METKKYELSNGVTVTQKELTLRKTFRVALLLSNALIQLVLGLVKGEVSLDLLNADYLKLTLLNEDNANAFLNIILEAPDKKEIDYLDLPNSDWIGAVEDFFTLNQGSVKLLELLKSKLVSWTQTLKLPDSEEK